MVTPARSPDLFPAHVVQRSVALDSDDPAREVAALAREVPVPPELARAVPKRQADYLAGRRCALDALRALGVAATSVPTGADRAPAWPAGVVGAITHTRGFASAAVARATDARGLGLDTERTMSARQARELRAMIVRPGPETDLVMPAGEPDPALVTLVFSAKETLFKCLYPQVGRYFDFQDAEVVALDLARGAYAIRLASTLTPSLPAGRAFDGRLARDGDYLHTGMVLPAG